MLLSQDISKLSLTIFIVSVKLDYFKPSLFGGNAGMILYRPKASVSDIDGCSAEITSGSSDRLYTLYGEGWQKLMSVLLKNDPY